MAKIYYSTQPVWWNTGNEIKPNRAAFNKFTFTQADNFNISWVDEMTIEVIVPNNNLCTLLKIEDNIDNITKYFYLLEVVNRTSVNQECVYELDVWLTYLLPYLEANKNTQQINTIRTLYTDTVAKTINIEPTGVPTGEITSFNINKPPANNPDLNLTRLSGWETSFIDNDDDKAIPGVSTNIYYVFKTKPTDFFPGTSYITIGQTQPNYVLVPVLNIAGLGLAVNEMYYETYVGPTQKRWETHQVLNTNYNLQELARVVNDFGGFNGLGEFLGVWVGPNFFRFKSCGIKVWRQEAPNSSPGSQNKFFQTTHIMFNPKDGRHHFNSYGATTRWCTFLALRVSSIPLEIEPLLDKSEYDLLLEGMKYQENTDSNIVVNATGVSFNNSFSYSNGLQTTTINIALPVAHDTYYNLLAAQRNTLNTSLGLSAMNSILGGLSPLPGLVPPGPSTITRTYDETREFKQQHLKVLHKKERITEKGKRGGMKHMGWKDTTHWYRPDPQKLNRKGTSTSIKTGGKNIGGFYGAALGVASAGAQFISTLAQQNAYKADLRIATSSAVLNENDRYLNWYKMASKYNNWSLNSSLTDNKTADEIKTLLSQEFIYGAETKPGVIFKFYGVDSQPQVVSITDTMETYLQIDENTALSLQNQWGTSYTPTIKAGMLSLLTEGIRITGDIIK